MSELINVTRSSMPEFEEYCAEIRDIWDSHWLTNMGEKHKALQAALETISARSMSRSLQTDISRWRT